MKQMAGCARACAHAHTDATTDVIVKAVHLNVGEGGPTVRFHYEVSLTVGVEKKQTLTRCIG